MSDNDSYNGGDVSDSDNDSDNGSINGGNNPVSKMMIGGNSINKLTKSVAVVEGDSDDDDDQEGGGGEGFDSDDDYNIIPGEKGRDEEEGEEGREGREGEEEEGHYNKHIVINDIAKEKALFQLEEDEDDDDDNETYLQKFNSQVNKNYIVDYHPECITNNYEEVAALSKIIRDANGNIIDDLHKTIPFLTKYERARILGQRAKQINMGAKAFVKVPEKIIDGYIIAELELIQKRLPFIIRRPIAGGGSEYWNIKDLENIAF